MTPLPYRAMAGAIRVAAPFGALHLLATDPIQPLQAYELTTGGELSHGVDSNPLELPGRGMAGAFTEAAFDLALEPSGRSRLGFMVQVAGAQRWYTSSMENADYGWADLRAGISGVPYRNGSRSFDFSMGGTYGAYRTTLIDPDTGEIYGQAASSTTTLPIPDRLDFDSTGAFLYLRWRANRSLLVYMDTDWLRRDYVQDYHGSPSLDSLNDRALSLEPGIRVRLVRGLILDISHTWRKRVYDDLSSLDEAAVEVSGEEREYTTTRTQVSVRYRPAAKWELLAGYRQTDRSDRFAGYYDYTGTSAVFSLGYSPAEATHLRVLVTRRTLDYLNAAVNNAPNGEIRESQVLRYHGEVSQWLSDSLALFATAGTEVSGNRDPAYVYDRSWAQAGVKVEF